MSLSEKAKDLFVDMVIQALNLKDDEYHQYAMIQNNGEIVSSADGAVFMTYKEMNLSNPKKYIDELVENGLILRHPDWTGEGRSIYFIVHWEYAKKIWEKI